MKNKQKKNEPFNKALVLVIIGCGIMKDSIGLVYKIYFKEWDGNGNGFEMKIRKKNFTPMNCQLQYLPETCMIETLVHVWMRQLFLEWN